MRRPGYWLNQLDPGDPVVEVNGNDRRASGPGTVLSVSPETVKVQDQHGGTRQYQLCDGHCIENPVWYITRPQ